MLYFLLFYFKKKKAITTDGDLLKLTGLLQFLYLKTITHSQKSKPHAVSDTERESMSSHIKYHIQFLAIQYS